MDYKENMGSTPSLLGCYFIKPEPQEATFPLSDSFGPNASTLIPRIKQQPSEDTINSSETTRLNASLAGNRPASPTNQLCSFTVHQDASEISYDPEKALKEGLEMVSSVQKAMNGLQVGSKLRRQVWSKEIEGLQKQALPTTLIAICGATGAGKSSILNAILEDNIVPTSGMRACTAVVTEISYHDKPTVDADVSFLSADEWKQELSVLLHDLVDEEGNLKRINDLKSDAGVAWHKVNAVYPNISQERLVTMTPDQIITFDPRVTSVLGTVKHIAARNSKAFAKEIAKYIDSKEKNRGKKDKKKDGTGKTTEKSLMDKVREASGAGTSKKNEKNDPNAPAFWPLIRQVNVRCRANCLSTGAILVDLPGVADANAARNNIAKAYMKKCQCLWILAPITRAVDDKTARDLLGDAFKMQLMSTSLPHSTLKQFADLAFNGNYDDHAITFIASKTDDISCSEVINALNLEDDPELEVIEEEIDANNEDTKEFKCKKIESKEKCKAIEAELKSLRERIAQYQEGIKAIKNGEPFKPVLESSSAGKGKGKKRKNKRAGKGGSPKRRRGDDPDSDEEEDESDEEIDDEFSSDGSDGEEGEDLNNDSDAGDENSESEPQEEYTEDMLKAKIQEYRDAIKEARSRLTAARSEKKEVEDRLATLGRALAKVQKRKNALCSLKRSEFSRDVLKQDFRTGLKELDDAAAEKRDPDNFDPTTDLRNYDAIDLPVFTCSSRDYVRLNNQVEGDGEPSCFSNTEDTGIPELQRWCHTLTVSSRSRTARVFFNQLKTFANSIGSYIRGIGEVTVADRETLRRQWESNWPGSKAQDPAAMWQSTLDDDPFTVKPERPELDVLHGVAPRLAKEFIAVIDNCVDELQNKFKDGLEDKCHTGAEQAAAVAVPTVDEFAASMHWGSYRATLRRHGCFRRDLNVELLAPFTRKIASAWGKMFESDLFGPFEAAAVKAINKLLTDVEDSAAFGLKDRVKTQGELCLQDAKVALTNSINIVKETMNTEQKEISRSLAPHVQNELLDGYIEAMEFRGTGSVKRQKDFFHRYVAERKDGMFDDGAEVVMDRLVKAAEAVGKALEESFEELAVKIEVALSVLWEGALNHDPQQIMTRARMVELTSEIIRQIEFWNEAEKEKNVARWADDSDTVMSD
ncbi:hypothetical protein E1B28_004429 [Marasmius oreades]|uniref:Dynamin N-terminal domain-containing protein n=1 Tax=Marasmius oreades TaxID=181124 RepID=A0A9P7UYP0_9AGAR|nr:uncharacterized protein E1B28_004429 [Marasmius oreades]KAG7097036.1 hypothetical protein E1B28_004429 [Marasmius oreades]